MWGAHQWLSLPTELATHHGPPRNPPSSISPAHGVGCFSRAWLSPSLWAHPATGSSGSSLCWAWRAVSLHNPPGLCCHPCPTLRKARVLLHQGQQQWALRPLRVICGGPEQGPGGDPLGATSWVSRTSLLGAGPTQLPQSTCSTGPIPTPQ